VIALLFVHAALPSSAEAQRQRTVRRPYWFQPGQPVNPVRAFGWSESTPEDQGLDSGILAEAVSEARRLPYLYSLLVIRNGHLVSEDYFNGMSRWSANDNYSVTKSFTSALVGIALDRGFLESLDQKMLDFFPEYVTPGMDPRKHDITIRHLLMMRAGFDWDDVEASFAQLHASPDFIRYILDMPLSDAPGTVFNYCTPESDLLSAILTRATGMSTREFAERYLFDPLGIQIVDWWRDPQGFYFGGREMFFTPRNMARLGQLYLQGGFIDGRKVVSSDWVEESLQYGARFYPWGPVTDHGYGYQWWLGAIGGYRLFFAVGIGGQYILVFPEIDMIVVTTANMWSWEFQAEQLREIIWLVAEHVLPAVSPVESYGRSSVDSRHVDAK